MGITHSILKTSDSAQADKNAAKCSSVLQLSDKPADLITAKPVARILAFHD